jgi:hypothetical protein
MADGKTKDELKARTMPTHCLLNSIHKCSFDFFSVSPPLPLTDEYTTSLSPPTYCWTFPYHSVSPHLLLNITHLSVSAHLLLNVHYLSVSAHLLLNVHYLSVSAHLLLNVPLSQCLPPLTAEHTRPQCLRPLTAERSPTTESPPTYCWTYMTSVSPPTYCWTFPYHSVSPHLLLNIHNLSVSAHLLLNVPLPQCLPPLTAEHTRPQCLHPLTAERSPTTVSPPTYCWTYTTSHSMCLWQDDIMRRKAHHLMWPGKPYVDDRPPPGLLQRQGSLPSNYNWTVRSSNRPQPGMGTRGQLQMKPAAKMPAPNAVKVSAPNAGRPGRPVDAARNFTSHQWGLLLSMQCKLDDCMLQECDMKRQNQWNMPYRDFKESRMNM